MKTFLIIGYFHIFIRWSFQIILSNSALTVLIVETERPGPPPPPPFLNYETKISVNGGDGWRLDCINTADTATAPLCTDRIVKRTNFVFSHQTSAATFDVPTASSQPAIWPIRIFLSDKTTVCVCWRMFLFYLHLWLLEKKISTSCKVKCTLRTGKARTFALISSVFELWQ